MEQAMQEALTQAEVISETATEKRVRFVDGSEAVVKPAAGRSSIEVDSNGQIKNAIVQGDDWSLEIAEGQLRRYDRSSPLAPQKGLNRKGRVTIEAKGDQWEVKTVVETDSAGQVEPITNLLIYLTEDEIERRVNEALLFGRRSNEELSVHKASGLEQMKANPGKLYVVHTQTDAAMSFVARLFTVGADQTENVNHSAFAFQGADGEVYVIDSVIKTDAGNSVRVKRLDQWAEPYRDVVVQELPMTIADSQDLKENTLFETYVDRDTNQPKIVRDYDTIGAILGGGLGLPIPPSSDSTYCSNLVCDILRSGGIELPELKDDPQVNPNELQRAIDEWIKRSQGQPQ
jgi:hypothetical protein